MLKLYVWEDVFCDYTCGIAFALANSKEEAIEKIVPDDHSWYTFRELQQQEPLVIELDKAVPQGWYTCGGD